MVKVRFIKGEKPGTETEMEKPVAEIYLKKGKIELVDEKRRGRPPKDDGKVNGQTAEPEGDAQ